MTFRLRSAQQCSLVDVLIRHSAYLSVRRKHVVLFNMYTSPFLKKAAITDLNSLSNEIAFIDRNVTAECACAAE